MRYVIGLIAIALIAAAAYGVAGRNNNEDNNTNTSPPPASQTTDNQTNGDQQTAETNKVTINNLTFTPADISVKKGETVTWTNNDSVVHTVEFETDDLEDSGNLQPGDTYRLAFNDEGTFNYTCGLHPQMNGTVSVTE